MVEDRTLRVSVSGRTAPCSVVGTAAAVVRSDAVIVTVRAGPEQAPDRVACRTVVGMRVVIELADELGDRLLPEGSRVFRGDGEVSL